MKNPAEILIRALVTEKSARESERTKGKVFTFEVCRCANKADVSSAIKSVYGVTPAKVHVINVPQKRIISRGKRGTTAGYRKAMVYLKGDDKIEFA